MDIQWLGHSCFRLRGSIATVITDPFDPSVGLPLPKLQGDFVTISHPHAHHSFTEAVEGQPYIIQTPGEFEAKGVSVRGLATTLLDAAGPGGRNVVYVMEIDGVALVHLGDLGQPLTPRQVEELTPVHVLMVPAGGGCTITPSQAAEAIRLLEPMVVIPMHYQLPQLPGDLRGVEDLLKELGAEGLTPQPRLSVTLSNMPSERRVVVMEPR